MFLITAHDYLVEHYKEFFRFAELMIVCTIHVNFFTLSSLSFRDLPILSSLLA